MTTDSPQSHNPVSPRHPLSQNSPAPKSVLSNIMKTSPSTLRARRQLAAIVKTFSLRIWRRALADGTRCLAAVLAIFAVTGFNIQALAATQTFGGSGALTVSTDWNGGAGPVPGTGDIALFNSNTGVGTYSLGGPLSIGELQFTNPTGVITIAGDTTVMALTLNGVLNALGANVGIDMSAAAQNVVLGGTADTLTVAAAQNWFVVAGKELTVSGTLSGSSNITIGSGFSTAGGEVLVNAASTDTGSYTVNSSTLSIQAAQATAQTYILNGGTLLTNQALSATNIVYADEGNSTFTSTASTTTVLGGNGNVTFTIGNSTTMSNTFFNTFGGVATWGNNNAFRMQSSPVTMPFGTFNFGASTGGIYSRDGGTSSYNLGAIEGTSFSDNIQSNSVSGAAAYDIGSANSNTTYQGGFGSGGSFNALVFVKDGTGTMTVAPNASWLATGSVSMNGGILLANYVNTTSAVFNSTSPFNFGGGSLELQGKSSGVTAQTIGNVTLTGAGGAGLIVNPNNGTSTTLTMGTITDSALGGTLNIQPVETNSGATISYGTGTATITTTTNKLADGTYGPRITFGSDWATTTSGASPYTLSAYSGYNTLASGFTGGTDTTNDQINTASTGSITLGSAYITNSLKIANTATQTLGLGGFAATVTNGGLLFAGNSPFTIGSTVGDGTLNSGIATTSDLIIQNLGTGGLTINSAIINGNGNSTLTIAGFGTTTLAGVNTYTGATNLNGGIASISSDANLGVPATAANLDLNGGTLQATATFALDNGGVNPRGVVIFGGGGTFNVPSVSNTLTVDGVISTNTALQDGPLIKTGAGELILTGANTYLGSTIISGGILSTNSIANGGTASGIGKATNAAGALVLDGGTLQYTGATASTDHTFTLDQNGGTIDGSGSGPLSFTNTLAGIYSGSGNRTLNLIGSNTGANTIAGPIIDASSSNGSGATAITKSGAGKWVLSNAANTYSGPTTVNAGTLALTSALTSNNIASSTSINVVSGATLDATGLTGGTLALASVQTLTGGGSVLGTITTSNGTALSPGTITSGDAGTGTLTLGNLTIGAGTTSNFGLSSNNIDGALGASANLISVGALTLGGSSIVQLYQPNTTSPFTTPGTYDLFQYTSLTGNPATSFSIGSTSNNAFSYTFGTSTGASDYVTLTIVQTATAATWNVDSNGNWSNVANWSGGVPQHAGDTASFGSVITAPRTVTLDVPETVAQISFNNANSYTISGANTLTLDGKGNGASAVVSGGSHFINVPVALNDNTTITVGGGDMLTFGGSISNASTSEKVTVNGAGKVVLSAANSYGPAAGTVGTTLSAGTVNVGNNSALSTGDVAVTANSTLQAGANGLNLANNLVIGGGVTATVDDQGNTFTLSGLISQAASSGALTKIGAGTVILSSNETYTGNTTVSNGTLQLGNGGAAGSVSNNIVDNATLALDQSVDYNLGNLISGSGGLNQIGSDNVTLTAANTFSGTTIISGGSLITGTTNALQNSTLNYSSQGGVLSFGAQTSGTLGGLTGTQNLSLTNASSGAVALSIGNNNASTSYSGNLGGSGSLVKVGSGTLTLTGNNAYSGTTTANGGLLVLGTGGVINGSGMFAASGNIQVNGGSLTEGTVLSTVTQGFSFDLASGSATFNDGLKTTSSGGDGALIEIDGGTFTATNVSLQRTANLGLPSASFIPPTIPTNSGFVVTGGVVNLGSLDIGDNVTTSSATSIFTGGNTTVTGQIILGQEQNSRFNYMQVAGGSVAAAGIVVGEAGSSISSELYLTSGTASFGSVAYGAATDSPTTTGTANMVLNGGTLYVGAGGIATADTSATLVTNTVLDSGTLGATASWSSSNNITLGTNPAIQAADSNANPFNIALSGTLGGAGGFTKTGGGVLTLSASNTYTGATTVTAGTLVVSGSIGGSAVSAANAGTNLEVDNVINPAATVTTGGRLSGAGTLNAGATVTGGILAPGLTLANSTSAVGALTSNANVTLGSNSTFSIRVGLTNGSTSDVDSLNVPTGSFNLTDSTTTLQLNTGAAESGAALDTIYTIVNGGASGTGVSGDWFANAPGQGDLITTASGYQFDVFYAVAAGSTSTAGSDINVELIAVPEPGTWASLLGGIGVLMVWQRNRRRRA